MLIFMAMFADLSIIVALLSMALIFVVKNHRTVFRICGNSPENDDYRSIDPRSNVQMPAGIIMLTEEDQDGFLQVWESVCKRFAHDPKRAVCYADLLMSDIVDDHPSTRSEGSQLPLDKATAAKYWKAHEIARRNQAQGSNPHELAFAMKLYLAVLAAALSAQKHDHQLRRHACNS